MDPTSTDADGPFDVPEDVVQEFEEALEREAQAYEARLESRFSALRGAAFDPSQPRDENGQWTADSGGETRSTPLSPTDEYASMDGPLWTGPVAESGLTKQWGPKEYEEFEEKFGFGPCGVMSVILREQGLGQIAVTYAQAPGQRCTFPHFIIIDKKGAIVDRTNPYPSLKYHGVQLLRPTEMPDLVDESPDMVSFLKSQLARGGR